MTFRPFSLLGVLLGALLMLGISACGSSSSGGTGGTDDGNGDDDTNGPYTLTYTAGDNGSIDGISPQTVDEGEDGLTVTAVPDQGYSFAGWSDAVATAARTDTNVTADITVQASFTINEYTLTYAAGANGTVEGNLSQTVAHGGSGTEVTAVADASYVFVNWSDGIGTASRTDTNVDQNINATANFAHEDDVPDTHTLTYQVDPSKGSITGVAVQTVVSGEDGSAVEVIAASGNRFTEWSDSNTDNPRTDLNVIADLTVSAVFVDEFSVTYDANTATGGVAPTDSNGYIVGEEVTVIGNIGNLTKDSYNFIGWNTAANGTGTSYVAGATFTMAAADVTLYAQWGGIEVSFGETDITITDSSTAPGQLEVTVDDGGSGQEASYVWTVTSGVAYVDTTSTGASPDSPIVHFPTNGSYTIQVTVTVGGATDSASINITVNSADTFTISGTVEDEDAAPASTVEVALQWTRVDPPADIATDSVGGTHGTAFSFEDLVGDVVDFQVLVPGSN